MHLTGTQIWCDARRRRDVCFASSIDGVSTKGHGQLIATATTLALLDADVASGHLAVPLRQRFALGTIRLELIPSGRGLGAAALHVDLAGRTVLYASTVRTIAGGAGDPAEVRPSDAVVVAAPFGLPGQKFPALDEVAERVIAWVRATPRGVLVVESALDALEIALRLGPHVRLAASRRVRDAASRSKLAIEWKKDGATLVTMADRAPVDRPSALVAARAIAGHAGHAAGFAWSNAADRKQLLGWIEGTGAREVFVTGACAESIVLALGAARARILGPPTQMTLL